VQKDSLLDANKLFDQVVKNDSLVTAL
jgi:hypothetical protein